MKLKAANALVSYISYIIKMIYPVKLAVLYPFRMNVPLWKTLTCLALLVSITLGTVLTARKRPYLIVGWLWYFGTLVPVSGLVQLGAHSMTDRYSYLPSIGFFIMLVWGISELISTYRYKKIVCSVFSAAVILIMILLTRVQVGYWKNDLALAGHAVEVTKNNFIMHVNFGNALKVQGNPDEAAFQYRKALDIEPRDVKAHQNLGILLQLQGKLDEAIVHYRQVAQIKPNDAEIYNNLGFVFATQGKLDEAIIQYRQALRINPNHAKARFNFGAAFQLQGKLDEAIMHYRQALQIEPNNPQTHFNLGSMLSALGKSDEAIMHYRQVLQIKPNEVQTHFNLGSLLQLQGKSDEAIMHYRRAVQISPNNAKIHFNLGAVLQSQGKLDEAIMDYRRALQIVPNQAKVHYSLGEALRLQGKTDEAITHYRRAAQSKPDLVLAHNNLAWILATHPDPKVRNEKQAIEFAERAAELTNYQDASVLDTLAVAQAGTGQFDQAVSTAQKAIKLASKAQNNELVTVISKRLQLYQQKKPYQEFIQK
jgi:tetratricopeptide (TPR) repeat protein